MEGDNSDRGIPSADMKVVSFKTINHEECHQHFF